MATLRRVRLAVLYDIHGNLPALEAVLADARREGCDGVLHGGDCALFGLDPVAVVDRLRGLGDAARHLRGNTDRYLADETRPPHAVWEHDTLAWYRERLGPERLRWLDELPPQCDLTAGHDALAVHATPRSDEQLLKPDTPEDEAAEMVAGVTAGLLLCGHVHLQYRRRLDGLEVVNPGSVGMPSDGDWRAGWAILDGREVELRRTEYDRDGVVAAMAASDMPVRDMMVRRLREARP
jgi:predicted phosphodiesterase